MFRIPGNLVLYYEDHKEIIRLLKTGDVELTAREMGKHLRRVQHGYMNKR
jgi:DNA-binding GntR family transcriptional regulator